MKRAAGCLLIGLVMLASAKTASAQQVGVGTVSPDASAMLDVTSSNKGLLIPRLLSAQRTGIAAPANGLLVYDIDSSSLFIYQATGWRRIKALSSINNLITGAAAGDVLVWDGGQWVITPKCNLFTYYFRDKDGDGHGDKYQPVLGCAALPGFVADSTDCDDNNALAYGGAAEICGDGIDNNCNGLIDESVSGDPDLPDDTFTDTNCDGIDGTEAAAIFVAITGNDANAGTRSLPVATIATGISKAITQGKTQVYISLGTYNQKVTLSNGISLYGGYNAATGWSRSGANTTIIQSTVVVGGRITALDAISITAATTVDRFTIQTSAATGIGTNNYAVYCNSCTALTLKNSIITAGNGAAGTGGGTGATGPDAVGGTTGSAGNCDMNVIAGGGPGGSSSCSAQGGNGGAGVFGTNTGQMGFSGAGVGAGAGGNGGAGGNNGAGSWGIDGGNGTAGANGSNGAGGVGGTIVGGFWLSSNGINGGSGTNGSGGGGGGGGGGQGGTIVVDGTGNGGGGGGGGACAGGPGTAGTAGGASFGLFLVTSSGMTITANTITSGNGGAGGNGGNGGPGGIGGIGAAGAIICVAEVGKGGKGGNGGNGGNGGGAGGSAGGPSYAIARFSTTIATAGNTLVNGVGGAGGTGGTRPGGGSGGNGATGGSGTVF